MNSNEEIRPTFMIDDYWWTNKGTLMKIKVIDREGIQCLEVNNKVVNFYHHDGIFKTASTSDRMDLIKRETSSSKIMKEYLRS